jgi:hypothetical protein
MMMDVSSGDADNNSDNDEDITNTSNKKRGYHDAVGNSNMSNDNDNEAKTTTTLMTNLTTMSAAEQMLSSTDLGDFRRDQFRFHHLLPEMIKRLSKYLEPKDAVALGATSRHLRTILSLSRLRPRTLIKSQGYSTMKKEGGGGGEEIINKPRKAFEIPSYKKANINIHTLKISFSWRVGIDLNTFQLGPAQQHEAKIWIIGRRSSTATTANHNMMFPGVGSARVVEESPPLKNTAITAMFIAQESQMLSINFVPLDGEVYELWYRLSGSETDPVHMILNMIQTEYLIFDNDEMLFGTSYETLLTNGVLKAWDIKREPGATIVISESFVANLLLSTCRSLRMKFLLRNKTTNNSKEGEDEPVIDDIMASFFDQFNIMKTPTSLQVVEDIVQAEIDERRVHQRIVVEAGQNKQPQRQQQPNLGGGGIAIGGGIRIQIDHQNGGQVHQIHLGPDGQPVVQAGAGDDGDNNNGQQQQQPQVFVHRMGGNEGEGMAGFPPGLFAAAGEGGEGVAGGLPGIFAAAAALGGNNGNNGGDGDPQQDAFGIGVDAGAAEQQQDENVNDQRNNIPDLRAGDDQNIDDNDPTINANNNQGGGPAVHVETVNMDLDDDDTVDDSENPDGNGGDDGGGRRPPPAQQRRQQHRNGQDQNGGYYGMLHDFLGIDQPPEGANDVAQHQQQNRRGAAAAAAAAEPPPPQNLQDQIPQQLQDALNQMQGQVPGLIGNIMNMVAQQQQPPPNPGNQGPNEEPQPEVHVVEMPPMAMGLEMLQQMMGGGMQGGGGVGGNIPFRFPNNNPNNNNFDDDDIPEID